MKLAQSRPTPHAFIYSRFHPKTHIFQTFLHHKHETIHHLKYFPIITLLGLLTFFACKDAPSTTTPPLVLAGGDPAINEISALIAQGNASPELYAQRATLYYEREGYDEAIRDLQQAMSVDSLNVDYHHLLADVYMDYFRSRLALRTMERAAALYPERIPTLLKLSEFQYILKQYEPSMATIDKALKIDARNPDAFFMLGLNFKDLGDTIRAINSFQSAVEIEPAMIDGWINLGQLHASIDSPLAERYFDNAIDEAPGTIIPLHAKADFLRNQGNLQGAIDLYVEINRIDRQYEEGYFNAGVIYLKQDSLEKAYKLFDTAIQVSPIYVKAYYFRGLTAEMMGNIAQAKADYQHALNFAPEYEEAQQGLARLK